MANQAELTFLLCELKDIDDGESDAVFFNNASSQVIRPHWDAAKSRT